MKQAVVLLLLVSLILPGCKKEDHLCSCVYPYQLYYLKARVIFIGGNACNQPVLDFSEDSLRIVSMMKLNALQYSAIDLPVKFNIKDKRLYISAVPVDHQEGVTCNSLGVDLLYMKVLDTKERE